MGLSKKEAYTFRRVARELLNLPLLSQAAEKGSVAWSKLREVVSVAVPETEELWLKLCEEFNCRQVRTLVTLTPKGGVPGDLSGEEESHGCEYRCRFSPHLVIIIERVLRQRSQKEGRAITFAEAVEQLFTEALMGKPCDEVEEKMRQESHREYLAEQMAKVPLVKRAKALAEELDLGEEQESWSHMRPSVSSCSSQYCAPQTEDPHQDLLALATGHLRFNPESRLATPAQRLALLRRDRYRCQTPSCSNTRFLDLHHVRWYSQKGETQPLNLLTICRKCHKKVHEKKLFISGSPEQGFTFTDAEGRSLERLHRLERAAWLDYWIGWNGEEHETHSSRLGAVS